jgi:hypothetical protein
MEFVHHVGGAHFIIPIKVCGTKIYDKVFHDDHTFIIMTKISVEHDFSKNIVESTT